ncbi:MAG: hypothetical protein CMH47_17765 [Muricauda sp.]|nr:hypothetical protein [Allomuricauda sp.]
MVLLAPAHFYAKNAQGLILLNLTTPHKQGPCGAIMIGRTRERATLLLLLFAPGAQKVSHNMGQDPVAYAVKVKSMGTEQGKSNRSTKADQKNSALKMLMKTNPSKIEKPRFRT